MKTPRPSPAHLGKAQLVTTSLSAKLFPIEKGEQMEFYCEGASLVRCLQHRLQAGTIRIHQVALSSAAFM